jgi:hypothetical protein
MGNENSKMTFLEQLPDQCPPVDAKEYDFVVAYRVVICDNPSIEDFRSHAARNKIRPEAVDPCRWASCSIFLSRDSAIEIARKLPKPRYKSPFLAAFPISMGDGVSLLKSKSPHVDFWMYADFDPIASIVETESVHGT